MNLSYVVITYNDAGRLPRCLASAALAGERSGFDWRIIVVDNGSQDHTGQVLAAFGEALGARLEVISLPENAGTTYSRNLALSRAPEGMVCVMDSDAELLDLDLRPIAKLLTEIPEVGIVGPRILLPDGHVYDSVKLLPTLGDKLGKLPHVLLGAAAVNRDWYPDFPFEHLRPVHTAISCCWFFRRELFDQVGPLDERIFYAPEDVDYCLRCWRAGRAVVYYPGLRVMHHTRQVSHKHPLSVMALSHFKGLLYYLRKHGYWFSRQGPAQRWIEPLAQSLAPRLLQWEQAAGLSGPTA